MPFVQRDSAQRIVAVSQLPQEGLEPVAADDAELLEFLAALSGDASRISATDQDFVRVLEDVVELLVSRGIILFTDLPDSAQEKMLYRQRLRSVLPGSLDLLGDD
jgi:hypothetical protein